MSRVVQCVDGVRVTELRYISFEDYLRDLHHIPRGRQGIGLKAMYVADYTEFCETHRINTEPDFEPESFKYCLTEKGLAVYNEIVGLQTKLKSDITEEQKRAIHDLIKQLREV